MRFLGRVTVGALAVLVFGGCFDFGGGGGCAAAVNGLAGNGDFTYECIDGSDPHCDTAPTVFGGSTLPTAVTRGGRFRLRFGGAGVTPVSTRAMEVRGGEFVALAAGGFGFVVLAEPEAIDAVRLNVVEPDALAITRLSSGGGTSWSGARPVHVSVDRTYSLRVIASGGGSALAGSLTDVVWAIDPPDAAALIEIGDAARDLRALRPGPIQLEVRHGALFARARIEADVAGDDDDVVDAAVDGGADDLDAGDAGDATDAGGDQ